MVARVKRVLWAQTSTLKFKKKDKHTTTCRTEESNNNQTIFKILDRNSANI